jgi:hypothetical protein
MRILFPLALGPERLPIVSTAIDQWQRFINARTILMKADAAVV